MHVRAFPPAPGRDAPIGRASLLGAGLTEAECFAAARGLPGAWWVQRDEDDRGHAGIGLVPDDGGPDDGAPTFLLRREDGPVRLACEHGGLYADLGAHPDPGAALGAVRRVLDAVAAATAACRGAGARPARPVPRPLRDPDAAAWRLAEWADAARRTGRPARADRLVCLAWEASDRPRRAAG